MASYPKGAAASRYCTKWRLVPVKVNPAEASAYIVNPLRGRNASNLFMTHPPVPERIARLRSGAWAV